MRIPFTALLLFGLGCGAAAAPPYRDPLPRSYSRTVRLYKRGNCDEYLARVDTFSEDWHLSHFEVSQLNLWSGECYARSGRTKEAINLWNSVVYREPDSGIADWARARIAGHTWKEAKIVSVGKARYPAEARRMRFEGVVHVIVTVQADGTPSHVHVVSATPGHVFDQAIIELFQGAKYEPARQDGKPVVAHHDEFIHFKLNC